MDTEIVHARTSPVGLILPSSLSVDQWTECGRRLSGLSSAVNWWIGDWLCFGEDKFSDQCNEIAQELGWHSLDVSYNRLANLKWVSRAVRFSTRVENLSWSHHRTVAKLSDNEQSKWLAMALAEGWSVSMLDENLRASTQLVASHWPVEKVLSPEDAFRKQLGDATASPLTILHETTAPDPSNPGSICWGPIPSDPVLAARYLALYFDLDWLIAMEAEFRRAKGE